MGGKLCANIFLFASIASHPTRWRGFAQITVSGLKLRDLSSFNLVPVATIIGFNSLSPQGGGPG
jgi:hypothetical protein